MLFNKRSYLRSPYCSFLRLFHPHTHIYTAERAQNEQKEIGDVKTYGMFDKIHFSWGRASQLELNGSRGVFITGPVARFITSDEVK